MGLSGEDCIGLVAAMASAIEAERDRLSVLDTAVGDGDHGVNMATALKKATAAVQAIDSPTPASVMRSVGTTLINEMGGASGVIFGSFFRGGSRAIKEAEALELAETALFLSSGLAEVQKRGKAQTGDKTLVDALAPAVAAVEAAATKDLSLAQAMRQAAEAAQAGAESTQTMVAKFGRAKFLGERALGHQDAGATSMAILLRAWADCI